MREIEHPIHVSGRSTSLMVTTNDRFGFQRFNSSVARGSRNELALRHLNVTELEG